MMTSNHRNAFSLVEVAVAIGVIGFALLAIIGLVPVGQTAARDAADDTKTSLIEQDVFERVRASLHSPSVFSTPATLFPNPAISPSYYYTADGLFFSDHANLVTAINAARQNNRPLPNYAVTVLVGAGFANALPNVTAANLKPVSVTIGYPLDSNGNIIGPTVNGIQSNATRKAFAFYVRKP